MTSLLKRCWLLYLLVALLLGFGINHRRVVFQTLDYLQHVPGELLTFAQDQDQPFEFPRSHQTLRYYKNLVKIFPDSATVQSTLGFCYYHRKEFHRALHHYERARQLNPELFGVAYNLGLIYYQLGRHEESTAVLKQAVAIPPTKTLTLAPFVDPYRKPAASRENIIAALRQGYNQCRVLMKLNELAREGHQGTGQVEVKKALYYYPPQHSKAELRKY